MIYQIYHYINIRQIISSRQKVDKEVIGKNWNATEAFYTRVNFSQFPEQDRFTCPALFLSSSRLPKKKKEGGRPGLERVTGAKTMNINKENPVPLYIQIKEIW